ACGTGRPDSWSVPTTHACMRMRSPSWWISHWSAGNSARRPGASPWSVTYARRMPSSLHNTPPSAANLRGPHRAPRNPDPDRRAPARRHHAEHHAVARRLRAQLHARAPGGDRATQYDGGRTRVPRDRRRPRHPPAGRTRTRLPRAARRPQACRGELGKGGIPVDVVSGELAMGAWPIAQALASAAGVRKVVSGGRTPLDAATATNQILLEGEEQAVFVYLPDCD